MKSSIKVAVVLSCALMWNALGCESTDLSDGDNAQIYLAKNKDEAKALESTDCKFSSSTITVGDPCEVTVENKNLKGDKDYAVEAVFDGSIQSVDGDVLEKGTMVLDLEPSAAGHGKLSVFEVTVKKGKESRKLKALCTFEVEAAAVVDEETSVDEGEGEVDEGEGEGEVDEGEGEGEVDEGEGEGEVDEGEGEGEGEIDDISDDGTCNADSQCGANQVCSDRGLCVDVPASCSQTLDFWRMVASRMECGTVEFDQDYPQCQGFDYTMHIGVCEEDEFCNKNHQCESYSTCELKTCEQLEITCSLMCSNTYLGCGQFADCCYRLGDGIEGPEQSEWLDWELEVAELINEERAKGAFCGDVWYDSVPPLSVNANSAIWGSSEDHAEYMAIHGYQHASGIPYGENIAKGQGSPESVVKAWMNSEGHCVNIMNPRARDLGVGLYYQARITNDGYFWVSRFGL